MRRLIDGVDLFETIRTAQADILVIMRLEPKLRGGRAVLGTMALPQFQGGNAQFGAWLLAHYNGGELPDFVLTLDQEWWDAADETQREALICHELLHCMQAVDKEGEPRFTEEGKPAWAIRAHDIEEFNEVAARYPNAFPDTAAFVAAATRGRNDR